MISHPYTQENDSKIEQMFLFVKFSVLETYVGKNGVFVSFMKHVTIEKNQFQWPKIPDIIIYKKQELICGILPPIPINSCGDYTLEKDLLEDVEKDMML